MAKNLRMPGSLLIAQINFKLLSTLFCTLANKIHTKHKATQSLGRPRHRQGDTVFRRVGSEVSIWEHIKINIKEIVC
jgi:hypothetical protein